MAQVFGAMVAVVGIRIMVGVMVGVAGVAVVVVGGVVGGVVVGGVVGVVVGVVGTGVVAVVGAVEIFKKITPCVNALTGRWWSGLLCDQMVGRGAL